MATRRDFLKTAAGFASLPAFARPAWAAQGEGCSGRHLSAMMGDYPHTHALHTGAVTSSCVTLDFAPVAVPSTAFARTVAMEFDVSELALVTFLQARSFGHPLVLIPAVMLSRFQHPYIVYNSERGVITPKDLEHARIGTRLYTATTASWLRGILADDDGVDINRMRWLAYQKPNVPEWRDPANVRMIAPGTDITAMLLRGEIDAAVLDPVPADPRIKPVIADPGAAAKAWAAKHNAIQINHMVVVRASLTRSDPQAVREYFRLLVESKKATGPVSGQDFTPFGLEANRRNLEIAIDYVHRTGLIPRKFTVDELFDDVTANLA